jgi:hypothetical protein
MLGRTTQLATVFIGLPLVLGAPGTGRSAATLQAAHAQAKAMLIALQRGQVAEIIIRTHPKVVDQMGGRTKAHEETQKILRTMEQRGWSFQKIELQASSGPKRSHDEDYLLLPYRLTLTTPKGIVEYDSFLVGVSSDGGKTWWFVNGVNDHSLLRSLLPHLPSSIKLPPVGPYRTVKP